MSRESGRMYWARRLTFVFCWTGDVQSTADAIHDALTMDAETKKSNHEKLWKVSLNRVWYKVDAVSDATFAVAVCIHSHQ